MLVDQASSLKRYPAQLSLTAWMCTVGGIQSTVFTVFMQHKPEDWLIGFGLKFWCIVYSVGNLASNAKLKKYGSRFRFSVLPLLTVHE